MSSGAFVKHGTHRMASRCRWGFSVLEVHLLQQPEFMQCWSSSTLALSAAMVTAHITGQWPSLAAPAYAKVWRELEMLMKHNSG